MAGINFKAFDLGGHEIARRVWKDYYAKVRRRQKTPYSLSFRLAQKHLCLSFRLAPRRRLSSRVLLMVNR